jgi:hypothetical protein
MFLRTFLSVLTVMFTASVAMASDDRFLALADSPVQVSTFAATYRGAGTSRSRDEILIDLKFTNAAAQDIVALDLRVTFYDAFNERLGRGLQGFALVRVPVGKETSLSWTHSPYAAFRFERYGTAVGFVDQIRFDDGTIWKADRQELLALMRQFEDSLTIEDLEGIGAQD